jgi:hypothetical protein
MRQVRHGCATTKGPLAVLTSAGYTDPLAPEGEERTKASSAGILASDWAQLSGSSSDQSKLLGAR